MTYVQGFLLAVPEANKEKYRKMATDGWALMKKHGATATYENWEIDVPDGEVTSFPLAVKRKEGEKIVFSWIFWPDKETYDKAWKAMMNDEEMAGIEMPFDGRRMMWGGFEVLFNA
ncbi:DUF1428 domain-containing protein [Pseudoruegeria sp. HB172150]|uniref:DUF1428 domain-containing protein n=1 Tax=Pseudoruegeria sp. HB172150 TaxID=2721164 RepID=UPI0015566397|nr:DUF1428 domain-containing protein [Pseudoruegeria sp. HB172150]